MSDTEKDIEDNNRHENSSDSKNESESKTEESPSKKEESTPQKPLSAAAPKEEQPAPQKAPVANTEKTKEKDDKKEQQKSKEEADDEQRHTADDKEKDDDTGARKVTFDSHGDNSNESKTQVDPSAENNDMLKNKNGTENKQQDKEAEKGNNMDLVDLERIESENQTVNTETHDSNSNTEPEQNSKRKGSPEPEQSKHVTESTSKDNDNKENNGDKNKSEEKGGDGYVPLDQLWSSPKREFKGSERQYSTVSTSSYLERKRSEEKAKTESQTESDGSEKRVERQYSSVSTSSYLERKKSEEKARAESQTESDEPGKRVERQYSTVSTSSYLERKRLEEKARTESQTESGEPEKRPERKSSSVSTSSYLERKRSEERAKAASQTESEKPEEQRDDSVKETSLNSSDNKTLIQPIGDTKDSKEDDGKNEERKPNVVEPSKANDEDDAKDVSDYNKEARNSKESSNAQRRVSDSENTAESCGSPKQKDQSKTDYSQNETEEATNEKKIADRDRKNEVDEDDWRYEDKISDNDDNRENEEVTIPIAHQEDEYNEKKFDSESEDDISVHDTTQYKEEPQREPEQEPVKQTKEPQTKKKKDQPKKGSYPSPSPRPSSQPNRNTQRPVARSAQPTSRPGESRRALSPAQMKSPRNQSTPRSRQRPKTTPGGPRVHSRIGSEDGQKRQKEFFKAELTRLQRSLKDESSKISKPKHREHYPFVWTSLEPYYNTYVARFLIDASETERPVSRARPISRGKLYAEDPQPGYVSRNTAIGLCDPWTDLRMDRELLPRLETPSKKSRAKGQQNAKKGKKEKPPKQGSTRLPKFPVVEFSSGKENATKCFPYSEVPKFRQEVMGRYKHDAPKKVNADYSRTKDDFYRMDLDRLDEVHPINRRHMRKAYFAYLQNTPGSKKAIKECVKDLNGEQEQKVH
ncbi:triadin-like isoform X2 [Crassostrea angulata]|uniref:triadin-like isoform X2 n=1 Tax=Magallana angulata TaxID=2784310 RepID=UPI0022B15F3D|nr:triadin-like isoform X2 [Crassostrea angulata]